MRIFNVLFLPSAFISAVSSSPPGLLSSLLQCSSFARLWHFHPHPETCPAKSFGRSDRSHGPASTCSMCWLYWVCLSLQQHNWCVFVMQALHLIGQALLEEKTQLEDRTVEDVTFDFTLKARSKWEPYHCSAQSFGLSLWCTLNAFQKLVQNMASRCSICCQGLRKFLLLKLRKTWSNGSCR